jgi:hypothetical protein
MRLLVEPPRWLPRAVITAAIVVAAWLGLVAVGRDGSLGPAFVVGTVGAVMIGTLVTLADMWIWRSLAWRRLETIGIETTAKVTGTPSVPRGPDSDSWTVRFRYSVEGSEHDGTFKQGLLAAAPPR